MGTRAHSVLSGVRRAWGLAPTRRASGYVGGVADDEVTDDGLALTCHWCGKRGEGAGETLTWTSAVENGRDVHFCEECSREHLRAIEGKLDSEHW